MKISTIVVVIIVALTMVLLLYVLPQLFDSIKKRLYLKKNKGYSDGFNVRNSMLYDAEKGKIEADQIPLH